MWFDSLAGAPVLSQTSFFLPGVSLGFFTTRRTDPDWNDLWGNVAEAIIQSEQFPDLKNVTVTQIKDDWTGQRRLRLLLWAGQEITLENFFCASH